MFIMSIDFFFINYLQFSIHHPFTKLWYIRLFSWRKFFLCIYTYLNLTICQKNMEHNIFLIEWNMLQLFYILYAYVHYRIVCENCVCKGVAPSACEMIPYDASLKNVLCICIFCVSYIIWDASGIEKYIGNIH